MLFKGFKIGKSKEKPDRDTAAGNTPVTQAAVLEEQINNKTKDLEAAKQQLKELGNAAIEPKHNEEAAPRPHGPLVELTLEPEDTEKAEETDAGILPGEVVEEVEVVKVKAEAAAPAEAATKAEAKKGPVAAEDNDSLSSLFNQEDEEVNPLANLINSLPDVTAQELLNDLQEIKEIIRESRRK